MHFRWTNKELELIRKTGTEEGEKAMCEFIRAIINERKSDCTNVYSPLYKTLQHAERYVTDWINSL